MSNHGREAAGENRYWAGSTCCKTSESCLRQEITHANEHSVNSTGLCSCSHSPSQQPCEVQRHSRSTSIKWPGWDASRCLWHSCAPHPRGVIPNGRLLSGRLWACWGEVGSQVPMTTSHLLSLYIGGGTLLGTESLGCCPLSGEPRSPRYLQPQWVLIMPSSLRL